MPMLKPEDVVEVVRKVVRTVRYGPRELTLATFGLLFLALPKALPEPLPKVLNFLKPVIDWIPWVGVLLLALAAWMIWRKVAAPLPEGKPKPPAIKGPAPFDPNDAELFARLGRKDDLDRLRAWILDDQKPLVALMGESGVGKTSLLRAGLENHLKGDAVQVIYWEALPTDPEDGLLHAVQSRWGDSTTAPASFTRLASAVARGKRVVVIDQAEQLSPDRHAAVFEMLRQVATASPPYAATWVVAFRREYSAVWRDFELGLPEPAQRRLETLSLRRFLPEQAERVIAVLAEEGGVPLEQKVVKTLVKSIESEGRVTPADIGISLLVLSEISANGSDSSLTVEDFRERGGQAGLLMRYLQRLLEQFAEAERREIFQGLLALVNLGNDQRVAEGKTPLELANSVRPASLPRFEAALRFLVSGKARVLEQVPEPPLRYRLIHERLIPVIRRLAGGLLVDTDLAGEQLRRAYRTWSRDRKARYLLSGRELKQALKFQEQLFWGDEEDHKREYLRLSRRYRDLVHISVIMVLLAVALGIYLYSGHRSQVAADRALLASWDLPPDLLDHLNSIEELTLPGGVTRFSWLKRAHHLRSLTIESTRSISSDNLPDNLPDSLRKLKIDSMLDDTQEISHLPKNLTYLRVGVIHPTFLSMLPKGLLELDISLDGLDSSTIIDISYLDKLKKITLRPSASDVSGDRIERLVLPKHVQSVFLDRVYPQELDSPPNLEYLDCRCGSQILIQRRAKRLHLRYPGLIEVTTPPLYGLSLYDFQYFELQPIPNVVQLRIIITEGEPLVPVSLTADQFPSTLRVLQLDTSDRVRYRSVELRSLPPGLTQLNITGNVKAHFPDGLPSQLKIANFGEMQYELPKLPAGLISLSFFRSCLPTFPKTLRALTIRADNSPQCLASLSTLYTLTKLELHGNIRKLPGHLVSLEDLDISDTNIHSVQGLPPNLISLTLRPGQVESLEGLPKSVVALNFRGKTSRSRSF